MVKKVFFKLSNLHDSLDVVGDGDVDILQLVVVAVSLLRVRLPGGGVTILHRELECSGNGGHALRDLKTAVVR